MTSHAGHDHPATKAGRAACRKGRPVDAEAPVTSREGDAKGATRTKRPTPAQRVEREVVSEILTTPHAHNPHDKYPRVCLNCGLDTTAVIHAEQAVPPARKGGVSYFKVTRTTY